MEMLHLVRVMSNFTPKVAGLTYLSIYLSCTKESTRGDLCDRQGQGDLIFLRTLNKVFNSNVNACLT